MNKSVDTFDMNSGMQEMNRHRYNPTYKQAHTLTNIFMCMFVCKGSVLDKQDAAAPWQDARTPTSPTSPASLRGKLAKSRRCFEDTRI